ncbi:MAG: nuclear transport factor 2 family protein [Sneathiella sp.]
MPDVFHDIQDLMERYYEGLYRCDTEILKTVFHPDAHYYTNTSDGLLHLDMPRYFKIIEQRVSPHSQNEPRLQEIEAIDLAGPATAMIRFRCRMMDTLYTDFLSLLKLDGKWWVMSKSFDAVPLTESER